MPDAPHALSDLEIWERFPAYRWLYNRLELAQPFGFRAAPHGIWPTSFPVVSKPIVNLYGMGVGAELMRSKIEYRFRPGCFWMDRLAGSWASYDLDLPTGTGWRAWAIDGRWASPEAWEVEPLLAWPQPIKEIVDVLSDLGLLPERINFEVSGSGPIARLVEAHPRWTAEFLPAYERGERFTVDVAWSESLEDPPPSGYTDTRTCDTNYLRLAEGKPARIGLRFSWGSRA